MSGAVISSSNRRLRGWARIPEQPTYAVTVHLVIGHFILKSAIADGACAEVSNPKAIEMAEVPCWFEFDVAEIGADQDPMLRVFVGETGECVFDAADVLENFENGQTPAVAMTYRDALASGMSEMDVLKALYLDILRRPIDANGLTHYGAGWAGSGRHVDHVRRSLLESEEYITRHKLLRDAAGNGFSRGLVSRSSGAVLAFEPLFASFCDDDSPLAARLVRFFPGLLVLDGAMDATIRDSARGLPDREVFFRALSRLADRPALVLDPDVPNPGWADLTDLDRRSVDPMTEPTVSVLCSSAHFYSGWHQMEGTRTEPRRWMKQIGIIRNPDPWRSLQKVEIEIVDAYGDTGALLAASDSEQLAVATLEADGGTRSASITSELGTFVARHLVLISSKATAPVRYDGALDLRCLSIVASRARFVYAEGHTS